MSQTFILLLSFSGELVLLLFSFSERRKQSLLYILYAIQHLKKQYVVHRYISKVVSNKLLIIMAISFSIAAIMQSCHSSDADDLKEKDAITEVPPTPVFLLQKGKLSTTLTLPGELTAFQQVDIYAKVSSFVKKLYADVGSEVTEGQLIAVMEAPEINSQLEAAQSRVESLEATYIASKANYDRLVETSKTPGTISPNDLDIALAKQKSDYAELQSAKSTYKEINDTKNYLEIRAPFTGVISARNVSEGAYVGPAGKGSDLPMFVLQEQKHLRLIVDVPEAYTNFLNDNSTISFAVRSLPNQTFKAKITRLSGALDTHLRSEHIEMNVINNDKKLLPGMVAEISIGLPAQDSTFIVPKTAIVNSTEGVFVIKVNNEKAQWVSITRGREANDTAEIFANGLSINDTLITVGSEEIRDSSLISKIKL